jgi:hypothetical protein
MSEEARAEVEQKEDEFVGQTEEAVGVMKNVSSFPLASLRDFSNMVFLHTAQSPLALIVPPSSGP